MVLCGANVIMWKILSSGANGIMWDQMQSFVAYVFMWNEMFSYGTNYLELMLSRRAYVIMWDQM